jgi:ISXO2-like transposase domain
VVLPWTHRVFANLKRWALGVHHGLPAKHLQSYLDAFVFRFSRRQTRDAALRSLLDITTMIKPVSYKMLISPETTA